MDVNTQTTVVALLVALSVASERLVEIIKGLIPGLNQENSDPKKEGRRKAALQVLAVLSGIVTALLAGPAIRGILSESWCTLSGLIALGLLASGGSGFWNAILTYVKLVKDIKEKSLSKL
jgi:drug/metabolite transporter (DMT)-like permease